jgi:signal transduction histidine kinase/ActR/RegA family two-component response regulator
MPPFPHLYPLVAQWRLDALALGVAAAGACLLGRRYLRQRGVLSCPSRSACLTLLAVVLAGALLAEWTAVPLGYPAQAGADRLVFARGLVLGAFALLAGALLVSTVRLALLRAEIRAQAEAERALQAAKAEADRASRAKSDFLAVASHEIRTPLNAVMGFANLLAGTRLDENQRSYVGTIATEGRRLTSLINDLLDLGKIEEGRLQLEKLPFSPVETATDVLRLLGSRAQEQKLDLRLSAEIAGPLLVAGDALRFRQILVNLVDNALKFTPAGSVTVGLSWEFADGGASRGRLAVAVRDTGIGIAPEKLPNLFQMFMQADSSTTRRYGGTGLGLAICQRLVRLMGGEISVNSTPGQGSEFAFSLPFPAAALPAETAADTTAARPPRILIVDDQETNRFLLDVFLRRNGFETVTAEGGATAIHLAASRSFDAILMDLQMPGIDGFTAATLIRQNEAGGRRIPIIALTAMTTPGTRERCFAAGMDDHLSKPLDLRRFKAILEAKLAGAAPAPAPDAAPTPQPR